MRKITVVFELPEDVEEEYSDVDPLLVMEDFVETKIGFAVIKDEK